MKFKISDKKALVQALTIIHSVVEKRNTLQILSNALLNVENNKLILKATDLEVSIETFIPIESKETGKVTVSAKNFLEIIKELPDQEIKIHSKENHWIEIQCGKSKFNIMGLAPEDFPALPDFSSKQFTPCRTKVLREMIDHTAYAISNDESRYQLNGVYLEVVDGKTRMVVTDGHRLAYFEENIFELIPASLKRGIIIPKKGILEVRKLLETGNELSEIAFEGNHLIIKIKDTYLSVRLIDGQYLEYQKVIPKQNKKTITLNRADFLSSLKRVSLLVNEKSKGVKFSIFPERLEISSNNPDIGEATENIDIQYNGESMEIGFNAKYLMESLSVLNTDNVAMELNDRMSPGVLYSSETSQYLSVLMPMRV